MPTFKPKNTKKIVVSHKESTTLDGKHEEYQSRFASDKETLIPELQRRRAALLTELDDKGLDVESRLEIKDEIRRLKKEITKLRHSEKNYYLNNSKHIFEYFESKKEIAAGNSKPTMLDGFFNLNSRTATPCGKDQTNVQQYLANIDEAFLDMTNFIVQTDICRGCNKGERRGRPSAPLAASVVRERRWVVLQRPRCDTSKCVASGKHAVEIV